MAAPYTTTPYRPAASTSSSAQRSSQQQQQQQQTYANSAQYYGNYSSYYSSQSQSAMHTQQPDGHEIWFMEATPTNRMLLSLRSGVPIDTDWALERLLALTKDYADSLVLKSLPGMTDALFELAEWPIFADPERESDFNKAWFAPSPEAAWRKRNALEALLVLRNASLQEYNMHHLEKHPRTFPLILKTMQTLGPKGTDSEYLLYIIELFQSMAPRYHLRSGSPILAALVPITNSPDRTLVIASLNALTALLTPSHNSQHIDPDSPAFSGALRLLPLAHDVPLLLSALDYIHAHLSHPPVTRAFFLHPLFPAVLRLLTSLILASQPPLPPPLPPTAPLPPSPGASAPTDPHELTPEQIERLLPLPEPDRAVKWMLQTFTPSASSSLTQVQFWTLYRETFANAPSPHAHLTASELIKNVNRAFPSALAMVMPGVHNLYIIKGVRRREKGELGRWACRWGGGGGVCEKDEDAERKSPEELWRHVAVKHLGMKTEMNGAKNGKADGPTSDASKATAEDKAEHGDVDMDADHAHSAPNGVSTNGTHDPPSSPTAASASLSTTASNSTSSPPADEILSPTSPQPCRWSTCPHTAPSLHALRKHLLTHIPPLNPEPTKPTRPAAPPRPPPPEPPSPLTVSALLVLRVLFREAYPSLPPSSSSAMMDDDRVGFPWASLLGQPSEKEDEGDAEGTRRARAAFRAVLGALKGIRVSGEADGTLADWMGEMVVRVMGDCEDVERA